MDSFKCYGSYEMANEECTACEYREYCRESAELDRVDSNTYSYSERLGAGNLETPRGSEMGIILAMFFEESTKNGVFNPTKFLCLTLRLGGLSYTSIADIAGCVVQTACNYIQGVANDNLRRELKNKNIILTDLNAVVEEHLRSKLI